ncbi:tRNA lysidine(34) synthetase TilS [Rhodovulum tesquicola]|uniref:tRNA lysidine(34) synthetase TilS n=1 Tax=Rhodovulum tesquicola TaxID=540254 RepID=UPI0020984471|nr:tRNA lysidine(34) synthetase TilS [Rhodovulum tesquicola]
MARALEAALSASCPGDAPLGVAVSGGGDSVALLLALAGRRVHAVTVDHGLRPEASAEARFVAETCARLGLLHETLRWRGWDGQGNLQDAARRARYRLIADWAAGQGIGRVALGHTRDDQAETVLMRLARGAGVDGLSAMAPARDALGVTWLRPFLGLSRADLRAFLTERGQGWIEDPSNEDARFDRVQARRALATLAPLGITAEGLAATAARMGSARAALEAATLAAARHVACEERGDVVLARAGLDALQDEIARRLLVAALCWVASSDYPPRAEALAETLAALDSAPRATLHGCLIAREGECLRIAREPAAVAGTVAQADALWDGRWRLDGPSGPGLEIRALGEAGLGDCPDWRATGLPRASLLASPGIWQGKQLVAAPLAGLSNGWQARLTTTLSQRIISH